ncbi:MAG: hypothetical protein ACREOM_14405 [Candidatus Dormibacteraceae bacterium]
MRFRACAVPGAALLMLAASACGSTQSSRPPAQPTVSGAAATASQGSGKLDPEVAMPKGFPGDLPVYPGARLTAGAPFSANGVSTFGMEWETLDAVDKVQAFFSSKLSQGDWTISFSGTTSGTFSAVFARKSNSKVGGLVGASSVNGITTITLSLVSG